MQTLIFVISMKFLRLSRRRYSARNACSGEERGETDIFVGELEFVFTPMKSALVKNSYMCKSFKCINVQPEELVEDEKTA